MADGLITTRDLAQALNVSTKTIHRWVTAGKIRPTVITPGNQYRFNLDDVLHQLNQPRRRSD
ncbi:helix-turn-helix domain-containing protein [Pseudonocardia kunmingensis]|uniref:Excisionase family DNA binding protein n=1 Tax=Pseudonocardia kunmingensis TaxID=630975 RepID=A0A543CYK2_9PSEU|nr:helix-turn-helix domain-containing protein [Pseudonocardia kunmingensis]TQM02165.1 excisionase family DNA binding protein [Pseudonocardia kunmingensis]